MITNSQGSPKQDQVISVCFLFVHRRSCLRRYLEKNFELIHVKTIIKKEGKRKKKKKEKKTLKKKRFGFVSFFSIFVCLRLVDVVFCLVEVVFRVWWRLCHF